MTDLLSVRPIGCARRRFARNLIPVRDGQALPVG